MAQYQNEWDPRHIHTMQDGFPTAGLNRLLEYNFKSLLIDFSSCFLCLPESLCNPMTFWCLQTKIQLQEKPGMFEKYSDNGLLKKTSYIRMQLQEKQIAACWIKYLAAKIIFRRKATILDVNS